MVQNSLYVVKFEKYHHLIFKNQSLQKQLADSLEKQSEQQELYLTKEVKALKHQLQMTHEIQKLQKELMKIEDVNVSHESTIFKLNKQLKKEEEENKIKQKEQVSNKESRVFTYVQ